jgi:phosphate transport system substrate-binding protein
MPMSATPVGRSRGRPGSGAPNRKIDRVASALAALAVFAVAACGGGGGGAGGDGGKVTGTVTIDGSSTVAPITEAVAEEYRREQPGVRVSVGISGTGGGFKKFCSGEIDIADASRAIKPEEARACEAAGIAYEELRIGFDGLAVVTSASNPFLECLDLAQLREIFREGGATTWDQVDPSFPKERIAIFAPGTDSGTYDYFVETVLGDPAKPGSVKPRTDYTASEDDNVLVQGVEGERYSWGFFGYAYFAENRTRLKDVKIARQKGGPCVAPTHETVRSGEYPLSRPLYIYVSWKALEKPQVRAFARFYLKVAPELVNDVGYTAAPDADYRAGLARLGETAG